MGSAWLPNDGSSQFTFANKALGAGQIRVAVYALDTATQTQPFIEGVTIAGQTATRHIGATRQGRGEVAWYSVASTATNGDIVVTLRAAPSWHVGVAWWLDTTGLYVSDIASNNAEAAPSAQGFDVDVEDGDIILVAAAGRTPADPLAFYDTFAGVSEIVGSPTRGSDGLWRHQLQLARHDVTTDDASRDISFSANGELTAEASVAIVLGTRRTIPISYAEYTPGGNGVGPDLSVTLGDLTGTTGPYAVRLATHPAGTTLSKDNIEDGTGDALQALSFSDADGIVSGQELTLTTSMTGGRLSFYIEDSLGAQSAVWTIDNVDVDATPAVVSAATVTDITATTAQVNITVNEAGHRIYVRYRLATDPAWTEEQIKQAADAEISPVVAG